MMANHKQIQRESFEMVGETCPAVDEAMAEATRLIKQQTGELRDALYEAIRRAIDAEERCSDLESKIAGLRRELDELRDFANT